MLELSDVSGFRKIAAAVVTQAANDLSEKQFRREAQTFLVKDMWGGWSLWLETLPRARVVALANSKTPIRRRHRRLGAGDLIKALRKRKRDRADVA